MRFGGAGGAIDGWAREFDAWVAARLDAMDVEALVRYRSEAPHADLAVPTAEHFNPLFVVLGSLSKSERSSTIYEGFQYGNISLATQV